MLRKYGSVVFAVIVAVTIVQMVVSPILAKVTVVSKTLERK